MFNNQKCYIYDKKLKEDIKNLKIVVSPIPFMIKKEILLNGYVIQI